MRPEAITLCHQQNRQTDLHQLLRTDEQICNTKEVQQIQMLQRRQAGVETDTIICLLNATRYACVTHFCTTELLAGLPQPVLALKLLSHLLWLFCLASYGH